MADQLKWKTVISLVEASAEGKNFFICTIVHHYRPYPGFLVPPGRGPYPPPDPD